MEVDWIVGWISEAARSPGVNVQRCRDNNELQYCLRSILAYAPWIRTIHVILGGNSALPAWLDGAHPQIHAVPEPSLYHPVQPNSETKKMFYHAIPGLADYFFTSDDDMFLTQPLRLRQHLKHRTPVLHSVGFCCASTATDGTGHIPLLWRKNDYAMAARAVGPHPFATMGKQRFNPWIKMKAVLLRQKLVAKGTVQRPDLWLWHKNVGRLAAVYAQFAAAHVLVPPRPQATGFICINDDFSTTSAALYAEQRSATNGFLAFLFPQPAPWERVSHHEQALLTLSLPIGKSSAKSNSTQIALRHPLCLPWQQAAVSFRAQRHPFRDRFTFSYVPGELQVNVQRTDKKAGWGHFHMAEVCIRMNSPKETAPSTNKDEGKDEGKDERKAEKKAHA